MGSTGLASNRFASPLLLLAVIASACSTPVATPVPSAPATSTVTPPAPTDSPSPPSRPTSTPLPSAGPIDDTLLGDLSAETDVPFTKPVTCRDRECTVPLDIVWRAGVEAVPTFVILPGGPVPLADRRYMLDLAIAVAERGAVVFLATYRNSTTGNDTADSLTDVACAVRFARAQTAERGGDPNRLILAGHSRGGVLSLQTAIDTGTEDDECVATGSARPDAAVSLAGFQVDVAQATDDTPPILVVSGSADREALSGPGLAQDLADAGVRAEYTELEGIDHPTIVDPARSDIVDVLFAAIDLADAQSQ